jgi:hypothetical protein
VISWLRHARHRGNRWRGTASPASSSTAGNIATVTAAFRDHAERSGDSATVIALRNGGRAGYRSSARSFIRRRGSHARWRGLTTPETTRSSAAHRPQRLVRRRRLLARLSRRSHRPDPSQATLEHQRLRHRRSRDTNPGSHRDRGADLKIGGRRSSSAPHALAMQDEADADHGDAEQGQPVRHLGPRDVADGGARIGNSGTIDDRPARRARPGCTMASSEEATMLMPAGHRLPARQRPAQPHGDADRRRRTPQGGHACRKIGLSTSRKEPSKVPPEQSQAQALMSRAADHSGRQKSGHRAPASPAHVLSASAPPAR